MENVHREKKIRKESRVVSFRTHVRRYVSLTFYNSRLDAASHLQIMEFSLEIYISRRDSIGGLWEEMRGRENGKIVREGCIDYTIETAVVYVKGASVEKNVTSADEESRISFWPGAKGPEAADVSKYFLELDFSSPLLSFQSCVWRAYLARDRDDSEEKQNLSFDVSLGGIWSIFYLDRSRGM